ncbi:helix-turn-helix domain-containing protein [Zobellella maritima]|uniref:helix-turn-helix domain-containing protein n=1 Tax=Zobellella maritima TaxID=2059725 RepID=UPI000E30A806|nr:AraC family transcriptional regulator [Zobellella maritima]
MSYVLNPFEIMALPDEMAHHRHDYNQIVIGLNGQTEFDIEGNGNLVGPGQGCLVSSALNHAFGGLGSNTILVVNLAPEPDGALTEQKQRLYELFQHPRYFQLSPQARQLVTVLSAEMRSCPDDTLLGQACANTLVCALQRHMDLPQSRSRTHRLNIEVIDAYIAQHLGRKITVAQLAGCVFLGESQFHLLFKEQTGLSPYQYVLEKRLAEARSMLTSSHHSLAYIAQHCGFSSQSLFTQIFSSRFDISPARYRKLHR